MVLGASFSPEDKIVLSTPKGIRLELDALEPESGEDWASCAVKKDAGDDPDATNGILVYARVSKTGGGTGPPQEEQEAPQGVTVLRKAPQDHPGRRDRVGR
jgi:cobalamin biosynthesis protein CbiD